MKSSLEKKYSWASDVIHEFFPKAETWFQEFSYGLEAGIAFRLPNGKRTGFRLEYIKPIKGHRVYGPKEEDDYQSVSWSDDAEFETVETSPSQFREALKKLKP